jgi:hypothetical protein
MALVLGFDGGSAGGDSYLGEGGRNAGSRGDGRTLHGQSDLGDQPSRELRFMGFEGGFNVPVYSDFVRRLLLKADAPIFLIADAHPVHRAKAVKQLAAQSERRLRLFQLPPY